jgi:ABC-type dipeptide/oligopeptide/nickel transport system permease subunit
MKKLYNILRIVCLVVLALPLALAWLPSEVFEGLVPVSLVESGYFHSLFLSFRELSITLVATMLFAMLLSVTLGYISVLSMRAGRGFSNVLSAVESIPSILVALFCYAPVSGYLARHSNAASTTMSLIVFVLAATVTTLPEAVRSIDIPLSDLYNRKYSLSFRSYGFTKQRILVVLMNTAMMRNTLKRVAAGILLKTLVLDCSFGFIIQLGFGSYGTPAHLSPGALIAAHRDALFEGGEPILFWLPSILLITISVAFLLMLNDSKEETE